jgi:hypothetical protein
VADCFWTDFVKCAEDCGAAPAVDMLNILNVFTPSFDPTEGTLPDEHGDLAVVRTADYNGQQWDDTSTSFTFTTPLRLADRGGEFSFTEIKFYIALDDLTTPDPGYSWGGSSATAVVDVGGVLHNTSNWFLDDPGVFLFDRDYQSVSAPSGLISALQALAPFEALELSVTLTLPAPGGHHQHETGTIADVIFAINNYSGEG